MLSNRGAVEMEAGYKAHQSLERENIKTSAIKSPCKAPCKEDFAVTSELGTSLQ